MSVLRVVQPGPFATVQDLGRQGLRHLGVPGSGAADRGALRLANRLVGNPQGTAGIEMLLGGLELEATEPAVVAVTGAPVEVHVDGHACGDAVALALNSGQRLRVGTPSRGLRSYLAVRGGVDVPPVLGSRSYEQLGRLGPAPLKAGDELPVGTVATGPPCWERVPTPALPAVPVLRTLPGPRADWLEPAEALHDRIWTVLGSSDRTGIRLSGRPLRRRAGELDSEGVLPGAVQLPADGQPIVLGPDAGVTGGYPVVAVVLDDDLDLLAQLAPGMALRFRT